MVSCHSKERVDAHRLQELVRTIHISELSLNVPRGATEEMVAAAVKAGGEFCDSPPRRGGRPRAGATPRYGTNWKRSYGILEIDALEQRRRADARHPY